MIISRFDGPALVESNVPRTELTSSSDIKQNIFFFSKMATRLGSCGYLLFGAKRNQTY